MPLTEKAEFWLIKLHVIRLMEELEYTYEVIRNVLRLYGVDC